MKSQDERITEVIDKLKMDRVKEYYDDKALELVLNEIGKDNVIINRFKGLGEMNADQLEETTTSLETRKLKQVTIQDGVAANEMFTILMGEEVLQRKEFIFAHAKEAELDI